LHAKKFIKVKNSKITRFSQKPLRFPPKPNSFPKPSVLILSKHTAGAAKEIVGGPELRELLHRLLSLNSLCHHHLILRAFTEI
jgi:hypothetical protein